MASKSTTAPKRIRILLADDHHMLREGLRSLLEKESDLEVVADVGDGREALALTRTQLPDVVIMDISMPNLNGVEAARKITAEHPRVKVLCLSVHREKRLVEAMLQAGASGYLLKTSAARELVEAVRTVSAGRPYLSSTITADVINHHVRERSAGVGGNEGLTAREREVLQLIAEGRDTKEIASDLQVSAKTILAHRENIMRKLNLHSTVALARFAMREGLAEL